MDMHHLRAGSGKPLLLVHGLGGHARSWSTIWPALTQQRDVIAVDLPGFGQTPRLGGETSIRTLADALTAFIDLHGLRGIDAVVLDEMRSCARAPAFDELLHSLAYGEEQQGAPRGSIQSPVIIGWGRNDRVCFPRQAMRARALFPDARLHWFERCGHFPHWDVPRETVRLILDGAARQVGTSAVGATRMQRGRVGIGVGAP